MIDMKKKLLLLLALMFSVTVSQASCVGVALGALFFDVDENGELMFGDYDTGLKESDIQDWLGMTEKMLVFTVLEDGTCSVGIGRATEYKAIKIPATHSGKTVTHIKCFRNGAFSSIRIPSGITTIEDGAFSDAEELTDVYYEGTEEQWAQIAIGASNEYLHSATIHFNYSEATDK